MLVHYHNYHANNGGCMRGLLDGWLARDSMFGIELCATHGRSRGGVQQYYVFAPEWLVSRNEPYSKWRIGFKAWDDREALELANADRRVEALYRRMYESEFRREIGEG